MAVVVVVMGVMVALTVKEQKWNPLAQQGNQKT